MEGFYINFQEPLVQQTNSLFSTQITDDLDDNFTQTDEFGIDIIDDKNDAVEMKVGDSFKDWDMNQYSGINKPKKVEDINTYRDSVSIKTNYLWQVSFYFRKQAEFPQYYIKKKNLYNAINKFCGTRIHDKSDAATLLMDLLKHHDEDPDYIVYPHLEGPSNELTELFWMTS
ncbi:unnamed protein product [Rhizophagus irregularis]|nr:unnamed protein product [Rhizophagus irregularis]